MSKKLSTFVFLFASFATITAQNFRVSNTVKVLGNEAWDYLAVDDDKQTLFVSHGTVLSILDLKTFKNIATILETKEVHGIAIAGDFNKMFVCNGKENTIAVYDKNNFEFIQKITIDGIKPDLVSYDKFSQSIYVSNLKSKNITVIDPNKEKVVKTIAIGGKPAFSVGNGKGLVYVALEDKNEIKAIDTKTLEIVSTWSTVDGEAPSALAFDSTNNCLFVTCKNNLLQIFDATDGKIVESLSIGEGCRGLVFDRKEKLLFAPGNDGVLTVIKQVGKNKYYTLDTVVTEPGARTLAYNKATKQVYLPFARFGLKPPATKKNPNPDPVIVPNSFSVLVVDSKNRS
jgi:YVTN family beta-propeller protein